MGFDKNLLLLVDWDKLSTFEKTALALYVYGGYDRPLTMRELVTAVFKEDLHGDAFKSKYGRLYPKLMTMLGHAYVIKYTNPVRYQLKHTRGTAKLISYVVKKLGFKDVTPDDFY